MAFKDRRPPNSKGISKSKDAQGVSRGSKLTALGLTGSKILERRVAQNTN